MVSETTHPRWSVRLWRYAVMLVSAAAAAVLSYAGLYGFAIDTGSPIDTAWMFPIAVDVLAAGALTYYVLDGDRFAHTIALATVVASSTMNGLHHLYAARADTVAPTSVVFAAGALAPLVLYVNAHLYARKRRKDKKDGTGLRTTPDHARAADARGGRDAGVDRQERTAASADTGAAGGPEAARDPGGRGVAGGNGHTGRRPRNTNAPTLDQLVAELRVQQLTGMSRRDVSREFGVSAEKAGKALKIARGEIQP